MNSVSYTVGDPEVLSPQTSYILSRTSSELGCALASYKKLLCMSTKTQCDIRVVSRNGKFSEINLEVPIRGLTSTESNSQHPLLFYGVSEKSVVIINPNVQASGNMRVSTKVVSLEDTVYAVTAGGQYDVLVLCTHTIHTVDERSGKIVHSASHPAKLSDGQSFDFHAAAKLIAIPTKSALQMLSLDSMQSIITKPFEPHTTPLTFTRFFQNRKLSEETTAEDVFILTAAKNNAELRFWAFNPVTKRFTLKEEVALVTGGDVDTLDFDISVTPCEEYVTLCSKSHSVAVIMEIDRVQFKVGKMTTWKTPGASKACCAQMSKVCVNKSVHMQLFLTIRTEEAVLQMLVDESKLASAANLRRTESPTNWFAQGNLPVFPVGNQQRLTSVSSSLHGECKALNTSTENNAASIVLDQVSSMNHELQKLDTELMKIQKGAGHTMRILESKGFEQMASKLGQEFAVRNKERLVFAPQKVHPNERAQNSVSEGIMTEFQKELLVPVQGYTDSLRSMTQKSSQTIISTLLEEALVSALEKASDAVTDYDATGSSQLYFSDSVLTSSVQSSVNNVCADIKGSIKKMRSENQTDRGESVNSLRSTVDQYIGRTMVSLSRLKEDLQETKSLVEKIGVPQAMIVDPGAILSKCISMGESGDWPGALRAALHASDTSILLNFLECEQCRENIGILTQPSAIELADFLSVCLQLSFEIESVPGAIPSRLDYLHMFLVEWDDYLQETKKRSSHDDRSGSMFKLIAVEFTRVLEALAAVDSKTLPRPSRTKYLLTRKIIGQLML